MPDTINDRQERDLPLVLSLGNRTGVRCVGRDFIRGAFKYLTIQLPASSDAAESPRRRPGARQRILSWVDSAVQKVLGNVEPNSEPEPETDFSIETEPSSSPKAWLAFTRVWVNCTAFPSQRNGRAYTGYFHSSDNLLNRIWYAGAYTLQLSTIDPREGSSIIDYNRPLDGNRSPTGAWYANFTIANGTAVTTDGAKRDRVVWPGDMAVAVPGIAVSTYDMSAVRNALDVLLHHQYADGSLPWAGPPLGFRGEFSDTYHLHTLLGVWQYVLFSGDVEWLRGWRWTAYLRALEVSMAKVDHLGLLHVTSVADWLRLGMTGHNVEASALLHEALGASIRLAALLGDDRPAAREPDGAWSILRGILRLGIRQLYCPATGLYADNVGRRNCGGSEHVDPQDGNSWVLISGMAPSAGAGARARNVSDNLRARWTRYGAPAVEFPNVISPFASSFELMAHAAAGQPDHAVELMLLEWGYLLEGPGFTNSTLAEGFRVDGDVQYPAYWSAARNSHCHGWASGPTSVLTAHVLGIQLRAPAGAKWRVRPALTRWLGFAAGGFATRLGRFEVKLHRVVGRSADGTTRRRRGQVALVSTPPDTQGEFVWGGASETMFADLVGGRDTAWIQWEDEEGVSVEELDLSARVVDEAVAKGDWFRRAVWRHGDLELVYDDSFSPPELEERPVGVVDWAALERNYAPPLADMIW